MNTQQQSVTKENLASDEVTFDDIKKAYHIHARIYYFTFGAILEPGRRALAKVLKQSPPDTVLEMGVGTGMLLKHYPVTSKVTGIDFSEDMLIVARQRAKKLSDHDIQLHRMDGEKLTFANESFDSVVLPYVLSVTPHPQRIIDEARRVCKKNGTIYILNHFSGSGFWWLFEKLVEKLAKKIGFRSEFSYQQYVLNQPWQIEQSTSVNLFGLSKFVIIRNI
ncbi:MAG TPA: methyltransferase domain-containing protein [Methylophilaceae bacterium]|jgi:phosphatidylethanolamine/phosphatidyl-N-methylethanolamine N-methyltransferase